ncbi:mitochondrial carrier domain-containing protein, partial [Baffinella frigidus]
MATDTKPKPAGLGVRMVLGALGGMGAACVCHPLDVIRVQMQIDGVSGGARAYSGPLDAASKIYARKGIVAGLYPGIDAAFLRQWTYGACRAGPQTQSSRPPSSATTGGGTPTIIRATLLSSAVLGCYSEVKEQLHTKLPTVFPDKNGIPLMFTGTVFASFVANGVSNPFDVVKSRVQNMPRPQPGQQPQYAGMADCFVKSVKGEGPMVLMRGFVPAFLKLAPYTTISLILTDNLARTLG